MTDIIVQKTGEDLASKSLQVTVPLERVAEAEHRATRRYAKQVRIPGFRKGRVPEAVVRKRFGAEIRETAIQELLRAGWEQAKTTESLKPIADPSVRNLKYEEGKPMEFELLVEVQPQLALERIQGFTLTRSVAPVTEEQVTEQVDRTREQRATWIPVEGERPKDGQMVRVDVAPIEEDVVHESKPYSMVLGSGQAIPDLEAQIMTLHPGETTEAEVRFPDDHPEEARRGQSRRVRIHLLEVKRQELPELDDAFAGEVGDFDSIDSLRSAIREDLEADAGREADQQVRSQLIGRIAEANQVTPPATMVDRVLRAFAQAYEVPEAQMEAFSGQFRPIAAERVVRDLILASVAEAHSLQATEEDIDGRVAELAERRGVPAGQLYTSLQKANRLGELEQSITEEKVFDFLLSHSTVTEVSS